MLLFFSHLMIIAICLIMRVFEIDDAIIGIVFVICSSLLTVIYLLGLKDVDRTVKIILMVGFVTRVILVVVDVFVTRLPESGFDDDSFYRTSLEVHNGGFAGLADNVYGGAFSKFLSVFYYLIGSSRFGIQYINVLFFVVAVVMFEKSLRYFNVSARTSRIVLGLICLMPNAILHNSILRRETAIELCVCTSIYFFSRWYTDKKLNYALLSILFTICASLFHTVFIFGSILLIIYFALYNKEKQTISFSIRNYAKLLIVMTCGIIALLGFLSMFQNKFSSLDGFDDVYVAANRARGGSVYLQGYEVHSFGELIVFTPLKLFYFLFSPVPWQFRNIMDVIMFFFDTIIYIILLFYLLNHKKNSVSKLMLTLFMVIAIVFALGTFNSGTAIRHRFSLLPYLLVSYALVERKNKNKKISENGIAKEIGERSSI